MVVHCEHFQCGIILNIRECQYQLFLCHVLILVAQFGLLDHHPSFLLIELHQLNFRTLETIRRIPSKDEELGVQEYAAVRAFPNIPIY